VNNTPATPPHRHTNLLAQEKSPYLLQHQHNPVHWFPWGEAAFRNARGDNKPIFLSIGYSTCHWCHVMERESFENHAIAEFLNAHFVSIKVDREERPDVDKIYMTAVQAMTGQGGWPLTCFLTPDLKPFFGGTYFPPESRYGRTGFLDLLRQVRQVWTTRRAELDESALELFQRLESATAQAPATNVVLTPTLLDRAAALFKEEYDPKHGGFGDAPKFPRPAQPSFLLWYGTRTKAADTARMVTHTCERMAAGGIYDQLGGGFARYSVDAQWLVPHFEKMLYDNAQLVHLYLDAFLSSGDTRLAAVVRGVIGYVLRDMTHPEGGFYSAEDADSEGKEGKFYCWTRAEVRLLLTADEWTVAERYFGITDKGNFEDHSDPNPLPGQNVLSITAPELSEQQRPLLASAKAKLFAARAKRARPHLDDKVLASWNGMMLGAVARAAIALGEPAWRHAAERNLAFLRARLWDDASGTLYHRWRDGARDSVQLLEAYASLLAGTIDLYEATLEPKTLEFALRLATSMLERFYDPAAGGFWQSGSGEQHLIVRIKDDYDGAEPSGNSVAVLALLKLAAITERKEFRAAAETTLRLFAERLQRLPQAVPWLLHGLAFWLDEPRRVVIAGDPNDAETQRLLRAAHGVYQPHKIVLSNAGPVEPFAKTLPAKDGPLAYVCTGTSCKPPTNDPKQLQALLR
jgi:hypothetical protein